MEFSIFVWIFFALVQLMVGLIICQFITINNELNQAKTPRFGIFTQSVSFFFVISPKILFQICVELLAYSIREMTYNGEYQSYKGIKKDLNEANAIGFINSSFLTVCFTELLFVFIINALYCQDRSLRRKMDWSPNNFYPDIIMIVIQIASRAEFIFVETNNGVVSFALLGIWIFTLFVITWYSSWDSYWSEFREFFFVIYCLGLRVFDVLFNTLGVGNFEKYYSYVLLMPIFAFQLCLIRKVLTEPNLTDPPKKENEAVDLIKELAKLVQYSEDCSKPKLMMLLCVHSRDCIRPECPCITLKGNLSREEIKPLVANDTAYIVQNDMPEIYKKGFTIGVFKLLLSELESRNKGDEFCITLAEAYFYYHGNYYYALEHLNAVAARKPSILLRQRIFNLRRKIALAVEESEADKEQTTAAIDYLKFYHEFIEQAEEYTELAIKFWNILLKDNPIAKDLNAIGKELFTTKKEVMNIVQNISHINSNHIEFLVRYGLLMKFVLQDNGSADQVFRKLSYLTQTADYYSASMGSFSIFRADVKVMFVVASIDSQCNGIITEVNSEFENNLGYAKSDVIGYNVTNLMMPMIARRHAEFVQKFFQTMEAAYINVPKLRFVKSKENLYVPCKALLKVVPRLSEGLHFALFMIEENTINNYAGMRQDATSQKVGAVICDEYMKIVGITKEAASELKLSRAAEKEIIKTGTLLDLFPQFENQNVMNEVSEREGRVVAYSNGNLLFEMDHDEEQAALTPCKPSKEVSFTKDLHPPLIDINNAKEKLVWVRTVTEQYNGNAEKAIICLVSQVQQEKWCKYKPVSGLEAIYENTEDETNKFRSMASYKQRRSVSKITTSNCALGVKNKASDNSVVPMEINDVKTVMIDDKTSTNTDGNSVTCQEIENQLRMQEFTKQMPNSIRRLLISIIVILAGIITLVGIF